MKKFNILIVLVLLASGAIAQSKSYSTLKEKFIDRPDVHSFSISGWVGRLVLRMTDEHEFKNAIKELDHVRILIIPRVEFAYQNLTVKGFKKLLTQDSFEQLAFFRENGEDVTLYLREGKNKRNHYFVLVEEDQEVVAIELKGYLDPELLNSSSKLASNK